MAGFAWSLPTPKFFEKFEQSPPGISSASFQNRISKSSGNPIFIVEDVCCIWWSSKRTFVRALCSDIWMNSDSDDVSCQEWRLDESVNFEVTHLTGRKYPREIILAWGPSGLAVIKYESRPGLKNSSLKCLLVAEKTYVEHLKLRIIQVKLHPSKKEDIVAVLNNDFYIRLYNLDNPNETISVVNAGHMESTPFIYSSHSVGLPEPPVDFEFGQRLEKSGRWVVFILKSSGKVSYRLLKTLDISNKCFWEAEQTIYTNEDLEDAFEDAACFFVTKTFPPVLTIGCLNGNLYHTVLLPSDTESTDLANEVQMEEKFWSGDVTLYVKEVLELEPDNDSGFKSLKLIQDPLCSHRYACLHDEGVHLINIHFVNDLVNMMQGVNNANSVEDQESTVRYVLCTKAGRDTITERGINIAYTESVPQKFLLLFGNGETLIYEIPHALDNFRANYLGKVMEESCFLGEGITALSSEERLEERVRDESLAEFNIEEVTKKLLTKNSNQPYLVHEDGKDDDFEKNEALLMKGARILKWEYLQRQEQVMGFLKESLDMLVKKSSDLKEDADKLSDTQISLRNRAEAIAESYEEANEREEGLHKRLEAVLLKYHQALPLITDEEKGWIRKLEALEKEMEIMKASVDGLKLKVSSSEVETPNLRSQAPGQRRTTRLLSSTQLTQIRNQVLEQHVALAHLAQSMKELEKKITLS